jgi:hypothetical protein
MYDVVVNDEDMQVNIQWEHGVPWIHIDIFKWTPRVYRKCLLKLNEFIDSVDQDVYAAGLLDNKQLYKFCQLMGGVEIGKTDESFIFVWEK